MIREIGTISHGEDGSFLKLWQVQKDPEERILREHRHINFEISVVLEGEGLYHTATGVHPMKPGDMFVFSGNEPHCITRFFSGGLKFFNLHFNWQFFSRCCPMADSYPNMFFAHSKGFCSRIAADRSENLRQLMMAVVQELRQKGEQFESAVGAYVNLMFVELTRNLGYYQPQEGIRRDVDKILQGVRFIDTHFCEDITLEQIAEKCGLTPNYVTKLFHECFQVKLWDYITGKRIDRAKRLLRTQQELTVLDIALMCGFHNTANFNRAFLKFTGITPSAYRSRRELLH